MIVEFEGKQACDFDGKEIEPCFHIQERRPQIPHGLTNRGVSLIHLRYENLPWLSRQSGCFRKRNQYFCQYETI